MSGVIKNKYQVTVCRIGYSGFETEVEADNERDAQDTALSEYDANYEIDHCEIVGNTGSNNNERKASSNQTS